MKILIALIILDIFISIINHLKLKKMAEELSELTVRVEENSTVVGSAITLLQGLKAALDAAGTDPVKLKSLSDRLGSNTNDLANAVAANTPAE